MSISHLLSSTPPPIQSLLASSSQTPPPIVDLISKTHLDDFETKMNTQLTDVQLAISQQDLNTQRNQAQLRHIINDLTSIKQSLETGNIALIVERMVQEFLHKDSQRDTSTYQAQRSANAGAPTNSLLKEFVVITDELQIMQRQVTELQKSLRLVQDEGNDMRIKYQLLLPKIEEKAVKSYVDYHLSNFLPKEAIFPLNQRLDLLSTKQEVADLEAAIKEKTDYLGNEQVKIKTGYCQKEEINLILDRNLESVKAAFIPRDEFTYYKEVSGQKIDTLLKDNMNSSKAAKSIENEFKAIKQVLLTKADQSQIKGLQDDLKQYCAYSDLRDLYKKVIPQIGKFEDKLVNVYSDIEQIRQMVERIDEILNNKSNKQTVEKIQHELKSLASIELVVSKDMKNVDQYIVLQQELQKLRSDFSLFCSNLQLEIGNTVRKQTSNIRNQLIYHKSPNNNLDGTESNFGSSFDHRSQSPRGVGSAPDGATVIVKASELKKLLLSKIDKIDLESMMEQKANKVDAHLSLRGVEVVHSQLSHVVVMLMEMARHVGLGLSEQEKLESDKSRQLRKTYLYKQMKKVSRWIFSFDPMGSKHAESFGRLQAELSETVKELKKSDGQLKFKSQKEEVEGALKGKAMNIDRQANCSPKTQRVYIEEPLANIKVNESADLGSPNNQTSGGYHTQKRAYRRDSNPILVSPLYALTQQPSPEQGESELIPNQNSRPTMSGSVIKGGIPVQVKNRLLLQDQKLKLQSSHMPRRNLKPPPQTYRYHQQSNSHFIEDYGGAPLDSTSNHLSPKHHGFNNLQTRGQFNQTVDPLNKHLLSGSTSLLQSSVGGSTINGTFSLLESPNILVKEVEISNSRKVISSSHHRGFNLPINLVPPMIGQQIDGQQPSIDTLGDFQNSKYPITPKGQGKLQNEDDLNIPTGRREDGPNNITNSRRTVPSLAVDQIKRLKMSPQYQPLN